MKKITHFTHDTRGKGRPQIVLVGNGLERESGQVSWDDGQVFSRKKTAAQKLILPKK